MPDTRSFLWRLIRLLEEAWLSVFILGYKINEGGLPKAMNADTHKGAGLVTLVEMFILEGIVFCLRSYNVLAPRSGKYLLPTLTFIIYSLNVYLFGIKGIGEMCVERFDRFSRKSKIFHLAVAVGICAIAIGVLCFGILTHRASSPLT